MPGVAKMGGIGGPAKNTEQAYQPGTVGVMSRSGGMTTEISSTLTAAGLGVHRHLDRRRRDHRLHLRRADAAVRGRRADPGDRHLHRARRAAWRRSWREWVAEHDSRLPIVAFMAGRFMDDEEMKGMSFGHAGTIVEGKEDTATEKIARLEAAGIPVVERIDAIPDAVRDKLGAAA